MRCWSASRSCRKSSKCWRGSTCLLKLTPGQTLLWSHKVRLQSLFVLQHSGRSLMGPVNWATSCIPKYKYHRPTGVMISRISLKNVQIAQCNHSQVSWYISPVWLRLSSVLCVCVGASVLLSHTSESYHLKTGKTMFGISLYHSTNPKTVIQASGRDEITCCWSFGWKCNQMLYKKFVRNLQWHYITLDTFSLLSSFIKRAKNDLIFFLMGSKYLPTPLYDATHTEPSFHPMDPGPLPSGSRGLLGLCWPTRTTGHRSVPSGQTQPRDTRSHLQERLADRDHHQRPQGVLHLREFRCSFLTRTWSPQSRPEGPNFRLCHTPRVWRL